MDLQICFFRRISDNVGAKEEKTMKKYYLYLSDMEIRLILRSLIRLKNSLIQQGRYTDIVDEVIVKVVDAPVKNVSI